MARDPAAELQRAVVAALKSSGVAGGRIYDRAPAAAHFPHVVLGEFQTVDDGADGLASTEMFLTLHAWSREPGRVQAAEVADAVAAVLHEAELDLVGFALVDLRHRDTRLMPDPDGLTTHAVLNFRALVDAA